MAALELLIEAWIELEAVIRQNQSGEDDGSVKDESLVRPKNEMELMNNMKKSTSLIKNTRTEVTSLKNEIRGLVQENLDLKKQVRDRNEVDKFKRRETQLKQELDDEKERVTSLMEEIDNLKERLRCSEVISNELKRQVKEVSTGNNVASNTIPATSSSTSMSTPSFNQNNNNPLALKQELKTVKEVIASREEMIQKLNDKYMRHRQVWEENERRANDEIKKLDEIIDRVVMTLSNCTPFINDSAPLKRLLEELTADQQNISNLSSTFVWSLFCSIVFWKIYRKVLDDQRNEHKKLRRILVSYQITYQIKQTDQRHTRRWTEYFQSQVFNWFSSWNS